MRTATRLLDLVLVSSCFIGVAIASSNAHLATRTDAIARCAHTRPITRAIPKPPTAQKDRRTITRTSIRPPEP